MAGPWKRRSTSVESTGTLGADALGHPRGHRAGTGADLEAAPSRPDAGRLERDDRRRVRADWPSAVKLHELAGGGLVVVGDRVLLGATGQVDVLLHLRLRFWAHARTPVRSAATRSPAT